MPKDLTEALDALTRAALEGGAPPPRTLGPAPGVPPIPAKTGVGKPLTQTTGGGGGGDLTETTYTSREWWASTTVASSDGLFRIAYRPLKAVHMTDAGGAAVALNFQQPS